eukprot:Hpha_TRINITY_DN15256_c1_g2::TRINITY_DN15256_c1_g2_i1::g.65054::m.65054
MGGGRGVELAEMSAVSLCCQKCSEWLMRESDTPMDARIKRLVAPCAQVLVPNQIIILLVLNFSKGSTFLTITTGLILLVQLFFLARAFFGRDMLSTLDVWLVVVTITILLIDLAQASQMMARNWGCVVLMLDLVLVFERPHLVRFIIPVTLLYILVVSAEEMAAFGLFDLVTGGEVEAFPAVCNCPDPPCGIGIRASGNLWIGVFVLLADFYFTRGFATDLHVQLRKVRASVEVAAVIAASLARYDVDGAEKAIGEGGDLPTELAGAYLQLLFNLRSYKAYLPHSCLVYDSSTTSDTPQEEQDQEEEGYPQDDDDGDVVHSIILSRCSSSASFGGSDHSEQDAKHRSLRMPVKRVRVSLAAGNMIGYLSAVRDLSVPANAGWIAADVERWCSAVAEAKGVVDLIGGDRRYASFNARQG